MSKFSLPYLLFLTFFLSYSQLYSQTTGKIAGKITDIKTGEPIPYANVYIHETSQGAAADVNGNYVILDVAPGLYKVTCSVVGYKKVTVENARVNVDFTTRLNFQLTKGAINLPAVIVQGERNPLIVRDLTNPTVAINDKTIQELPVDQISDIIKLQAGVVQGNNGILHVRGGYGNEISYTLNGVPINDPYGNTRSISIATNAVKEVSVSTGTFSAQYGNALSGVVNYVTKEGGNRPSFSLRAYSGDYITNRTALFTGEISHIDPLNSARLEATLGGPIPFTNNKLHFYSSGVFINFKGSLYGNKLYKPSDSYLTPAGFKTGDSRKGTSTAPYYFNPYNDYNDSTGLPTGNKAIVPMNPSKSINFQGNISYKLSSAFKLEYDVAYDKGHYKNYNIAYKYNPEGIGTHYYNGLIQTLGLTHMVNSNIFYTLKFSYADNQAQYYLYKNYNNPGYLPNLYNRTISNTVFLAGGTDNYRLFRKTTTIGVKGDLVAQLFTNHEFKLGFELRKNKLSFEGYSVEVGKLTSNGFYTTNLTNNDLLYDSALTLIRRIPVSPALYTSFIRRPTQFAAYIQDKMELASAFILNIGVRYEFFDPDAYYNDNLSKNLTDSLSGFMNAYLVKVKPKQTIAPRISVSYPITDRSVIRFSYGHFYQMGSLGIIYGNPNFFVQNVGITPTFGNPNVNPQKSVQYEIGWQQQLSDNSRFDLTGFYKDVRDYIYTETIYTTQGRQFNTLTNLAYSSVRGITFSFLKRRSPGSMFSASLNYTFSVAEGNRTYPASEIFFSEKSGEQSETYLVPLSFDRSQVINGTFALNQPNDWTLGVIYNFQTGTPYTPQLPPAYTNVRYKQNSARQQTQWNVNLKFEKYFKIAAFKYSVFIQVNNLFDTQNELYVYPSSGRALTNIKRTQDRSQFSDIIRRMQRGDQGLFSINQINDYYSQRPERVSRPREVRLGFTILFN